MSASLELSHPCENVNAGSAGWTNCTFRTWVRAGWSSLLCSHRLSELDENFADDGDRPSQQSLLSQFAHSNTKGVLVMSELKTLLAEARASLQDLDSLLQRARSLDEVVHGQQTAGRQNLQSCIDELLRVIERIPTNLRHEERLQREAEIEQLHLDMEQVRHRVEASIERMEAACEHNVTQLAEFIETLQQRLPQLSKESQDTSHMSQLNDLLSQGRQSLANRDYEACMAMMSDVLHVAPENPEAVSCLEEAQRKLEDQRLEEELVIHLDNLKKEASDLFDQEKYRECAGLFKFLCELEPKNRMLQDYLELSQEKVREIEELETSALQGQQSQNAQPTVDPDAWERTDAPIPDERVARAREEVVDTGAEPLSPPRTLRNEDPQEEVQDSRPVTSLAPCIWRVSDPHPDSFRGALSARVQGERSGKPEFED